MDYLKTLFKNYSFWLQENPGKEKSLMTLAVIMGVVGWLIEWPILVFGGVIIGLPNIVAYIQRKI